MGYTESHKDKGRDYHDTFAPEVNPHRAMIWRLEQRALDQIFRRHFKPGPVSHLDFACGTGRILAHFAGRVSSTGVDVSSSMMEVARTVAPATEFIQADLTQQDVLLDRQFDLVTAFRFFPNAEAELRRAVVAVLARHLAPQGVFVFNNHKNRNSLRYRISRLLGREDPSGTMRHADVEALITPAGLRILQVVPLAVLPFSEYHLFLPIAAIESLERGIGAVGPPAGLAQDLIYVCGRAQGR